MLDRETVTLGFKSIARARSKIVYKLLMVLLVGSFAILRADSATVVKRQQCKLAGGALLLEADLIEGVKNEINICKASGAAEATISSQEVRIHADLIQYDKNSRSLEASGNARMFKNGFEKKGNLFKIIVDKIQPPREISSLDSPCPGKLFGQRLSLFRCLNRIAKVGVSVSEYILEFEAIERMVRKDAQVSEAQEKIDQLRHAIGQQLGSKEQLIDQFYGNGPLTKFCSAAEDSLRADLRPTAGFEDFVCVLCTVNQDGSVTQLEVDDPADYSASVCALACERVKALKLKTPDKDPVSLMVTLSNQPEINCVYVRDISYDTYISSLNARVKKIWHPTPLKSAKTVILELKILRDGSIASAKVFKSSGSDEFDREGLKTLQLCGQLSPLPDGSPPDLDIHFSVEYNYYGK